LRQKKTTLAVMLFSFHDHFQLISKTDPVRQSTKVDRDHQVHAKRTYLTVYPKTCCDRAAMILINPDADIYPQHVENNALIETHSGFIPCIAIQFT